MLQQICEHIHNFFIKDVKVGAFSISNGMISPSDFLLDGQRFWITNSALNDGVYTYHASGITNDDDTAVAGLSDEDFNGTVCAMAVPPAVIALSGEIRLWVDKYSEVVDSPYQSESFGGYSYTKASGSENAGWPTWQSVFGTRLNAWRKISL